MHELLSDRRYEWRGPRGYVVLDPAIDSAQIFVLRPDVTSAVSRRPGLLAARAAVVRGQGARASTRWRIEARVPLGGAFLVLARVRLADGTDDRYALPLLPAADARRCPRRTRASRGAS